MDFPLPVRAGVGVTSEIGAKIDTGVTSMMVEGVSRFRGPTKIALLPFNTNFLFCFCLGDDMRSFLRGCKVI